MTRPPIPELGGVGLRPPPECGPLASLSAGRGLLGRSPRSGSRKAVSRTLQDCTLSPPRTPARCAARTATASARTGCCAPGGKRKGWGQQGYLPPAPFKAHSALILTSEGCPAPTTMSLPSSRPTSTWLRSLVTATLRMGTFMGRGGAAGSSLEGGRGHELATARQLCIQQVSTFSHVPSLSSFEGWLN